MASMCLLQRKSNGETVFWKPTRGDVPAYAILSHAWGEEKVIFEDMEAIGDQSKTRNKLGWKKIQYCADQAASDRLQNFWVYTCCIDKRNTVELSAAITSMFQWYQNAARCHVYPSDVSKRKNEANGESMWGGAFQRSRWFTRGWTLQELIPSRPGDFSSAKGDLLGSKSTLGKKMYETTGIAKKALQGDTLSNFNIQERRSWAEHRNTMIEEKGAYCLIGICGVSVIPKYGEGRKQAFRRLEQEICKFAVALNLTSFPLTSQFVARKEELSTVYEVLHDRIHNGRSAAVLYRLGGFEKTQLGIEYAKQHKEKYIAILWRNSDDENSLQLSSRSIAHQTFKHHFLTRVPSKVDLEHLDQVIRPFKVWAATTIQALQDLNVSFIPKHISTLQTVNNPVSHYSDQGKQAKTFAIHSWTLQGKKYVDDTSDLSSSVSIDLPPNIISGTTLPNTAQIFKNAAEEFADIVIEDIAMKHLLPAAIDRTTLETFKRNFIQLLVKYAVDLRAEACNTIQAEASFFIMSGANLIVYLILKRVQVKATSKVPTQTLFESDLILDLEQWSTQGAQQHKIFETLMNRHVNHEPTIGKFISHQPIPSLEEKDDDGLEKSHLTNLREVKMFMIQSVAFQNLRDDFWHTILLPEKPSGSKILSGLRNNSQVRPSVAELTKHKQPRMDFFAKSLAKKLEFYTPDQTATHSLRKDKLAWNHERTLKTFSTNVDSDDGKPSRKLRKQLSRPRVCNVPISSGTYHEFNGLDDSNRGGDDLVMKRDKDIFLSLNQDLDFYFISNRDGKPCKSNQ